MTKGEADRLAKKMGRYSRIKVVNGYAYYAVKNRWVYSKVRQSYLGYLGACADE